MIEHALQVGKHGAVDAFSLQAADNFIEPRIAGQNGKLRVGMLNRRLPQLEGNIEINRIAPSMIKLDIFGILSQRL